MLVDKNLEEQILFLNDPSIQTKNVNRTCERCIMQDCKERVAEPMVIIKRQKLHKIQEVIRHLDEIQ